MDSALPSPSAAWSRLATSPAGESLSQPERSVAPVTTRRREDDAAQLKARLLRMIVDNEQSRKSGTGESYHSR
jgi:hypothetical protein